MKVAKKKSLSVFAKKNRWSEMSDPEWGWELLYVLSPHSELIYEDNQRQNTLYAWVNEDNKSIHASNDSTRRDRACLHCSRLSTGLSDGRLGIKITKKADSAEVSGLKKLLNPSVEVYFTAVLSHGLLPASFPFRRLNSIYKITLDTLFVKKQVGLQQRVGALENI